MCSLQDIRQDGAVLLPDSSTRRLNIKNALMQVDMTLKPPGKCIERAVLHVHDADSMVSLQSQGTSGVHKMTNTTLKPISVYTFNTY